MAVTTALKDDFQSTMLVMDAVDELRRQEIRLAEHADADEQEEAIKERLKAIYSANGIVVTDELIERAMQAKLDKRFAYTPTEPSMMTRLASLYIKRDILLPRVIAGVGVLAFVALLYQGLVVWPQERELAEKTAFVVSVHEQSTSAVAARAKAISETAKTLDPVAHPVAKIAHPEPAFKEAVTRQAMEVRSKANVRLQEAGQILAGLQLTPSPALSAPAEVSAAYQEAQTYEATLRHVDDLIRMTRGELSQELVLVKAANRSGEVRSMSTTLRPALAEKAAILIADAERQIVSGKVEAANNYLDSAQTLGNTQTELDNIAVSLKQAMSEVMRNQPDGAALAKAKALEEQAQGAINRLIPADASKAVAELNRIASLLSQELTLRVTTEGKSGVWRYPNDNPSAKNYYLIVEAMDSTGAAVELPIVNEETNTVESAKRFGVRVSEATYESVKADKLDNGIIERNIVAVKKRGSLDYTPVLPIESGRITRW